ncbi:hypothetical protein HDZ31DRAFT_37207 [Schizophyllum fasciatum]
MASTRRSSRLAAAPRVTQTSPRARHETLARKIRAQAERHSDRAAKAPTRKRRKTKDNPAANVAEGSGSHARTLRLAALHEMPLDILLEIFSYVSPVELFNISRSCKTLHNALMRRSSNWIWKRSYATKHNLPLAPEDMTVPQFLSLLFDKVCHFCPATRIQDDAVNWAARVRYCKKCLRNKCTLTRFATFPRSSVEAAPSIPCFHGSRRLYGLSYPTTAVYRFVKDYDKADVQNMTTEQKKRWLAAKISDFKKIQQQAELCQVWVDIERRKKEKEEDRIRKHRKAEIIRRLKELGWGHELRNMFSKMDLECHELVDKPQPFSGQVWDKIRAPLIQFMEETKANRIAEEKQTVINDRRRMLVEAYSEFRLSKPFRAVLPGVGDFLNFQQVADVVENTAIDQQLSKSDLRAALDAVPPSRIQEWKKRCDAELVKVLNSQPRKKPATPATLKLATTVFSSTNSNADLPYPLVLVRRPHDNLPYSNGQDLRKWSADHLSVSPRARVAEQLVKQAGLNPLKATREDMDTRDPWYIYTDGPPKRHNQQRAMTWRYAVRSPVLSQWSLRGR